MISDEELEAIIYRFPIVYERWVEERHMAIDSYVLQFRIKVITFKYETHELHICRFWDIGQHKFIQTHFHTNNFNTTDLTPGKYLLAQTVINFDIRLENGNRIRVPFYLNNHGDIRVERMV